MVNSLFKSRRRFTSDFFKNTVEVGHTFKSIAVANITDTFSRQQVALGVRDSIAIQKLRKGVGCSFFEITTKGFFGQKAMRCHFV